MHHVTSFVIKSTMRLYLHLVFSFSLSLDEMNWGTAFLSRPPPRAAPPAVRGFWSLAGRALPGPAGHACTPGRSSERAKARGSSEAGSTKGRGRPGCASVFCSLCRTPADLLLPPLTPLPCGGSGQATDPPDPPGPAPACR
ncbi:hypothetical protein HJG60_009154 [Phyllostomus discolor]|uniref:Secreted protein n=1 Tax=Phyllostomus discolor TaxID=89673 RepID=A0A833YQI5_9CHIR|nr:hypothetical protein HJG60_009154 [Phyllostomus discolor]